MLFICLLVAIGISAYSKEMFGLAEKISKDRAILKKAWLPILVWIILIIWALVKLFV